jgi:hypothetical protein
MQNSSMAYRSKREPQVWTAYAATIVAALAWTLLGAGPTSAAEVIDHSAGFGNHSDLTANGSATFVGTDAEVTDGGFGEAGSIFSNDAVHIVKFNSTFTFSIVPGTSPMADGMTFTIQSSGPTALGPSGGGLGYGPDSPGGSPGIIKSVAIKFDIFDFGTGEGNDSSGVFSGGRSPTVSQAGGDILIGLKGTGIDLNSQDLMEGLISYQGGNLTVTLTDTTTGASFSKTVSVDIPLAVGGDTANVGFTGGTGGLSAVQAIHTWTFRGGK